MLKTVTGLFINCGHRVFGASITVRETLWLCTQFLYKRGWVVYNHTGLPALKTQANHPLIPLVFGRLPLYFQQFSPLSTGPISNKYYRNDLIIEGAWS
jgi:hypothetical protein